MDETFEKKLEQFLKENGVEEISDNNKERLKMLYKVVRTRRVDMDCLDYNYSTDKNIMDSRDYVSKIQHLQINITEGNYYIANIKGIIKEEKRQKFAAKVKKIFGIKEK